MQPEYYSILGALSVAIGLVSYVPYLRDVFAGKTKPHPFSWLIWGLLDSTVFIAQVLKGAGAGSWATGVTSVCTFIIAVISFRRGEKRITSTDWLCLVGGLGGMVLWYFTNDPLYAVIVVTITNAAAMIPTMRKSFSRPHEETMSLYALAILKWIPALFAMESFTPTNWLFPASLVFWNLALVLLLIVRRQKLR